jgi:hypothetical protein
MATVRISQLTAITTPTDDDILIINDADTNTRKITYANLTQGLLNTGSTLQTKSGPLTVQGLLTAGGDFVVDTNTFYVDSTNNRVGIKNTSPDVELDVDGTIKVRNANAVQFGDANNSNYVAVKSPGVVASNFTLTLPDALPLATNLLTTNAAGTLAYSTGITYNSADSSLDLGAIKLTNQGSVRFYEDSTNGSEYIQLNAPASLATTNTYSLPSAYPAASGYVLASDTSGILSWVTNAAGAAGAAAQIQYNDGAGVLAADADFTFVPGTNTMSVPNATITTLLDAQGDVNLGNAVTDTVTITGVVDSDIIPSAGTEDLGGAAAADRWAEIHGTKLFAYGSGIEVDGGDIIPANGTEDIGSFSNRFAEIHGDVFNTAGITLQATASTAALASAATFNVTLGALASYSSHKVMIQATDDVTGDTEFYEQFVTHDGTSVSELTGSNVQSTPGTFLTTPVTSISGTDLVLGLTNSAATTNNISIKVHITSITA